MRGAIRRMGSVIKPGRANDAETGPATWLERGVRPQQAGSALLAPGYPQWHRAIGIYPAIFESFAKSILDEIENRM